MKSAPKTADARTNAGTRTEKVVGELDMIKEKQKPQALRNGAKSLLPRYFTNAGIGGKIDFPPKKKFGRHHGSSLNSS